MQTLDEILEPRSGSKLHHEASKPHTKKANTENLSKTESQKHEGFWASLTRSSPTQIWKSRLSWRVTLSAFITILAVQAGVLSFTVKRFEENRLQELQQTAKAAIAASIVPRTADIMESPFTMAQASRIIAKTKILGLGVYTNDFQFIRPYGEPLAMTLNDADDLQNTFKSSSGRAYEVIYTPSDLGMPYYVTARLDATAVTQRVREFIEQNVLVVLLMSAFVTVVLMVALGYWLLEPIFFLRRNLIEAGENPENPRIYSNIYDPSDDLGGAIEAAENLIRQNARNIHQMRKSAEDQIHNLAYYDQLTGLPNRILFLERMRDAIEDSASGRDDTPIAVMALDLDHFKDINDSMGHTVGDALLKAVGQRLCKAVPRNGLVARTGEDEYAIMVPLRQGQGQAEALAKNLQKVLSDESFQAMDQDFQVRASIGYSVFPLDGNEAEKILKNADIALNRAKEEGRGIIQTYTADFDRKVQARFQMLRELRQAMEQDELTLHYQPQFSLKTGALIGAEALLRWWKKDDSKEGGHYIPPAEFIPVAENSGLIVPMGRKVIELAATSIKRIAEEAELPSLRIAVNVSGAQFYQGDLVGHVKRVISETGIEPQYLELEVTESVFMDDVNHTIQLLQELHKLGVELAIDDFGTGYSSLSYLRQFPIDRLKIDRSFLRDTETSHDDASIARTIVRLGHSLNLKVIAEGIETSRQEEFLRAEGCDEAQGFRYSKPVPYDDFLEFAKSYSGDLSFFEGKS